MKTAILLILSLGLSFTVRAQELQPFVNFLRSAPAWVDGDVTFDRDSVLYQEGWSIVKIQKDRRIDFSFRENWLEVRPGEAFYVKYAGFRVKIDTVRWTPKGLETESTLPVDFTGLSRRKVSAEVARTIENLFGEKLRQANAVLKTLRSEQSIDGLQKKAFSIVAIFSTGVGGQVVIPSYRGDIGVNILPETDRAFNLYGVRIGIKGRDHYRSSIGFTGNTKSIYPHRLRFSSRQGVDINKGKEFRILARLVITGVTMDASGMDLNMRLGASEITSAAMWALLLAARLKDPNASCKRCEESAKLPAFHMIVEKELRKAAVTQIRALVPQIRKMNVSPSVLNAFFAKENCRQSAITCLQEAKDDSREAQLCDQGLKQCLR